jgi:hypothetical protein
MLGISRIACVLSAGGGAWAGRESFPEWKSVQQIQAGWESAQELLDVRFLNFGIGSYHFGNRF